MLEKVTPDAVTAFGNIYDHLKVVQTFAPLGIHVMVQEGMTLSELIVPIPVSKCF